MKCSDCTVVSNLHDIVNDHKEINKDLYRYVRLHYRSLIDGEISERVFISRVLTIFGII